MEISPWKYDALVVTPEYFSIFHFHFHFHFLRHVPTNPEHLRLTGGGGHGGGRNTAAPATEAYYYSFRSLFGPNSTSIFVCLRD